MVPVNGKLPAANETVAGGALNEPKILLYPTFGVGALSCATTKYCIESPEAIPPFTKLRSSVKLNGLLELVASEYFHPSVALVLSPPHALAFVNFL